MKHFDVIVIGGGHAGTEAAAASARILSVRGEGNEARVALVTHRFDRIGEMSCNPAIGGLGKGHLVREIDALDGLMARVADRASIQYRLLNRSKGPAVQGPRAQIDRALYREGMQAELRAMDGLEIIEGEVTALMIDGAKVAGVELAGGVRIGARKIIVTTGTFLGGTIHIGEESTQAGRMGDEAATRLAEQFRALGLPVGRLKTGTPPRIRKSSINWDGLARQEADAEPVLFSSLSEGVYCPQIACGVTATNARTHAIIRANLHLSAMYSGKIEGVGPRYCPSIEDKISRFADKTSHLVFLEPEGLTSDIIYPNGISTSLPREVQEEYVRSIAGLERAEIAQYGYAVEYDYIDPRALRPDLSLRALEGLYLAGQINGTTGYEEAGAQGLVAGLNAALAATGRAGAHFGRENSYIGVLIDDLTSRGVSEPYRMFTSRAEYRLSIRADNADQRLTPMAIAFGLASPTRRAAFEGKADKLAALREYCQNEYLTPNQASDIGVNIRADGKRRSLYELLGIPAIEHEPLRARFGPLNEADPAILQQITIEASYASYVERQARDIARLEADRAVRIPASFDYANIQGLSNELMAKLSERKPASIADAQRIEGITPSALTLITAHLRKTGTS